jgi:hypothetical protein
MRWTDSSTAFTTPDLSSGTEVRWNFALLCTAITFFLLASLGTIRALEIESRPLAIAAAGGMVISAAFWVLSIWLPRRKVDWRKIEAEQRLWESGPLGRSWLKVRRRLDNLWKL